MSHVLAENYTVDGMAACQLHNIRCILQRSALGEGMGEFWASFAGLGKAGMACRGGEYLGTYLEFVKGHQPLFRASMRSLRSFDIEGLYRRTEGGVGDDFGRRGIDSSSDRRYLL